MRGAKYLYCVVHAEVGWISADACKDEVVGGWIVVGEAAGDLGRRGWVELPANAEVDGELGADLPLVAGEGEEPPLPVCGEEGVEIAAGLAGQIEEEAGDVVGDVGLGAGCRRFGRRRRCKAPRGLKVWSCRRSSRTRRRSTPNFDGVIADDLGPVVDEVDVGFGADPGDGGGVADERVGEAAVEGDADLP